MIGRSGKRGSGISVLATRHDDDDGNNSNEGTLTWLRLTQENLLLYGTGSGKIHYLSGSSSTELCCNLLIFILRILLDKKVFYLAMTLLLNYHGTGSKVGDRSQGRPVKTYLIILRIKQECIKYHFLSLWYDSNVKIEPQSPGPLSQWAGRTSKGK